MSGLVNIDPHGPYAAELVALRGRMTPQEIMFVEEILVDLDHERAAIAVNLPPKQGRSFFKRHYVYEAWRLLNLERTERLSVRADKTLEEFAKLAYSNIADYYEITPEGDPRVNLSKVDRDRTAALTEMTVENYVEGRGDAAREVKRVKIKMADKLTALNSVAKHLGMMTDRVHHTGEIDIKIQNMSRQERLAYAFGLLKSMEKYLTPAELAGEVIEHEDDEAAVVPADG